MIRTKWIILIVAASLIAGILFSLLGYQIPLKQQDNLTLAVTIDDLPVVGAWQMQQTQQFDIFGRVLDAFQKHEIKAYGFAVGVEIQPHQQELLQRFVDRGHKIDNHTFSHFNFNKKTVDEYIEDIKKGEDAIVKWQTQPKYFRYPFLVRGDSMERRVKVENYLQQSGYTIAPVTIDSSDWKFNEKYIQAIKNKNLVEAHQIGEEYVQYVKNKTADYTRLAQKHLSRQPRHILLIHMNMLNSIYLEEILDWYAETGWKFNTLDDALKDPVYAKKDQYVGEWGVTWLQMLYGDI